MHKYCCVREQQQFLCIQIDVFHSSGHGGQNVNKVATAVRIVHNPTGIVVVCQDERSQYKNKTKAMSMLRAKIYEVEQQRHSDEISKTRREQVGSAERSEKIRTYNSYTIRFIFWR